MSDEPTPEPPMGRGVLRVQRQRARDWAGEVTAPPEATAPPAVIDVPHVTQSGDTLTCTMGNWEGEPTAYAYQWQHEDGTGIGDDTDVYTIAADDIGHTISCVVTATNDNGTTEAPPSNGVVATGD